MKLGYTILYVADVKESVSFYQRAFGLSPKFVHEGGDFGEMDTGTTSLAFSSRALMTQLGKAPKPADSAEPNFEIAFVVDDVPAALDRAVAAGAKLVQAPQDMPWGQTVAYVADMDDFLVELCTPVAEMP